MRTENFKIAFMSGLLQRAYSGKISSQVDDEPKEEQSGPIEVIPITEEMIVDKIETDLP